MKTRHVPTPPPVPPRPLRLTPAPAGSQWHLELDASGTARLILLPPGTWSKGTGRSWLRSTHRGGLDSYYVAPDGRTTTTPICAAQIRHSRDSLRISRRLARTGRRLLAKTRQATALAEAEARDWASVAGVLK